MGNDFSARVLADSISPSGHRLTTLLVCMPRIVLAEFNTHRDLSRSSASSRAVPVKKRIAAVRESPFVPKAFGKNQKGMQPGESLEGDDAVRARNDWLAAADVAAYWAGELADIGVHKQYANRLLEPFLWHEAVVSATQWSNFFALRRHAKAMGEIRDVADAMHAAMVASTPTNRGGEVLDEVEAWHLPFGDDASDLSKRFSGVQIAGICAARCARVSYERHDTGERDPEKDLELARSLARDGHMSPLEHVAFPIAALAPSNFRGWTQLRKMITFEERFDMLERNPDLADRIFR